MKYYVPSQYDSSSDDGLTLNGAYGPRIFTPNAASQFERVTYMLLTKPDTRQAVMQIFSADDIRIGTNDVPCTLTLQFLLRDGALHLSACMRSNDAFLGFTHDVFVFTMLQEVMARTLGVRLGKYHHYVGSLHLYDKNTDRVQAYLTEGVQRTTLPMPAMPEGSPWPSLRGFLEHEKKIREDSKICADLKTLNPYWADLVRLLQLKYYVDRKDETGTASVAERITSAAYGPFARGQLWRLQQQGRGQENLASRGVE